MKDLRCPSRLHGKSVNSTIEVKCDSSYCGAKKGVVVMHYFDEVTGHLVDTQKFQSPEPLFVGKEK